MFTQPAEIETPQLVDDLKRSALFGPVWIFNSERATSHRLHSNCLLITYGDETGSGALYPVASRMFTRQRGTMPTLDEIQALVDLMTEVPPPSIDELPDGQDSTAWVRAQNLATINIDTRTGHTLGFTFDAMREVAAFTAKLRSANLRYKRGTRFRVFLDQTVKQIVAIRRSRGTARLEPSMVVSFNDELDAWFASVAVERTHVVPCAILPVPATPFTIGPVRFLHYADFKPTDYGMSEGSLSCLLDPLGPTMQQAAASWLAIVTIDGCEPKRSIELADLAVDVALAAIQLVIQPDLGALISRATARAMPPSTSSLVITETSYSHDHTNLQPGRGLTGDVFDALMAQGAAITVSCGPRIEQFIEGAGALPKLELAWCDAAFWFHEALAEPLDTVAVAKLETAIENLFAAASVKLSNSRILDALDAIFGLGKNDNLPRTSVRVSDFVEQVVTARSRILHGTWSTLADEIPLGRGDVATLVRDLLLMYTLCLDAYETAGETDDKVVSFLAWIKARRAAKTAASPNPQSAGNGQP